MPQFGDQKVTGRKSDSIDGGVGGRWTGLCALPQEDFCQQTGRGIDGKYQPDGGPSIERNPGDSRGSESQK